MQCQFCKNPMYVFEKCILEKDLFVKTYRCGNCDSIYETEINKKGQILKKVWYPHPKNIIEKVESKR